MKRLTEDQLNARLNALLPEEEVRGKKPVPHRASKPAADRHKPVVKKDLVLSEGLSSVTLDARAFQEKKTGAWRSEELAKTAAAYPGKEIRLKDPTSKHLYLDREQFFKPDGTWKDSGWARIEELRRGGGLVSFYDRPKQAQTVPPLQKPAAKTRLDAVPQSAVKRIERPKRASKPLSEDEVLNRKSEMEIRAQTDAINRLRKAVANPDGLGKNLTKDLKLRKKSVPKTVIERPKQKNPSILAARLSGAKARRENWRDLFGRVRRERLDERYEANILKEKQRRNRKRVAQRKAKVAENSVAFRNRLSSLPGFGSVPVKMLMRENGISARVKGAKGALASLSRGEKYPARNLGSKRPFAASAKGLQSLSVPSALIDEEGNKLPLMRGARRGDVFVTSNTRPTERFPVSGPGGIFFRIDADAVIDNLVRKFPQALSAAAISVGDMIGRKMLDIVEPYVPKDTGLLYQSGQTSVEQTAGGMVDIEGGELYPSSQMFGVSISYDAPYAAIVYFDETKAHGQAYNDKHNTAEKDPRETMRWIEVAFQKEKGALSGLLAEYSRAMTVAMNAVGVSVTRGRGQHFAFQFPR